VTRDQHVIGVVFHSVEQALVTNSFITRASQQYLCANVIVEVFLF